MSRRKKLTDLKGIYRSLLPHSEVLRAIRSRGERRLRIAVKTERDTERPLPTPAFCCPALLRLPPTTSGERRYNAEVMGQSQRKWGRCLRQRHREGPSEAVRNIERRGWFDLFGVLGLALWRALTVLKNRLHLFRSGGFVEVWREVVSSHKMEALWTAVTPPISLCQPVKGGGGLTRRLLCFIIFFSLGLLIGIALVRLVPPCSLSHNHQPNSPTREVWWSQYITRCNMDTGDLFQLLCFNPTDQIAFLLLS